jgi:hypothetical protein
MNKKLLKNYGKALSLLTLLWLINDYFCVKFPRLQWLAIGYTVIPLFFNPLGGYLAGWLANDDKSPRQRAYYAVSGAFIIFALGVVIILTLGSWFHFAIGGNV